MDEQDLAGTLEKTVGEFSERSGIDIVFDNQLGNCQLGPNTEIHVVQVVREALSNIMRHSHAKHAIVSAVYEPKGEVIVSIDDDGIGMPEERMQRHHYGLAIMRERAKSLNGEINFHNSKLGGTCVKLRFDLAGREKFVEQVYF